MKSTVSNKKRVVVVGGGITGLAAAYILAKAKYQVTVLEAAPQVGGLLNTYKIGKTDLEYFYHHFFTHDAELHWLLKELNIFDKLTFYNTNMGFYYAGDIYSFNGAKDLLKFRPLNLIDKIRFGLTSLYLTYLADWKKYEHIAAVDWFNKYAGKNVTRVIWEPMLKVKFGSYASKVPIAWMIGRLSQRVKSRKSSGEKLGYIDGSVSVLLKALLKALKKEKVQIVTNAKITKIVQKNNELSYIVAENQKYQADLYVFTIPNHYFADLIKPLNTKYYKSLLKVKYFGAACTILQMNSPLSDIYWLNIADKKSPFGGVVEQTNLLPPRVYQNRHVAYLSKYFDHKDKFYNMPPGEIQTIMLDYLAKIYPYFNEEKLIKVDTFKTLTAATVCDLKFSQKVPKYKSPYANLFVANMAHVYPDERSINNSIRVAANLCKTIGVDTSHIPHGLTLAGDLGV